MLVSSPYYSVFNCISASSPYFMASLVKVGDQGGEDTSYHNQDHSLVAQKDKNSYTWDQALTLYHPTPGIKIN